MNLGLLVCDLASCVTPGVNPADMCAVLTLPHTAFKVNKASMGRRSGAVGLTWGVYGGSEAGLG